LSAQHVGVPWTAIATGLVHAVHPLDELAGVVVEHLRRQLLRGRVGGLGEAATGPQGG